MRRRYSIRTQLLALVAAALLPPTLYSVASIRQQAAEFRHEAEADALALARQIAARLDDHILNVESLLVAAGQAVAVDLSAVAANDARLRNIHAELPAYFGSISVLTPQGRMLSSATVAPHNRPALDFSDREYFRGAIAKRALAVGEPIQSRTTGKWIVILARPLLGSAGEVRAVVAISTQLELFQGLLAPEGLPPGTVLTLLSEKGQVLARSIDPASWIGRDISGMGSIGQALRKREGAWESVAADGVARLAGFSTARRVPWLAYAGIPLEIALARERAAVRTQGLLVVVSLLIASALAWLMARRIAGPVRALGDAARIVASGNLAARAPVTGGREMASVAAEFNRMLDARVGAEQALAKSEERFRKVFAGASVPMSISAADTGALLEVNEAFCAFFGFSRAELIGRTTSELGLWADPSEREALTARLRASGRVRDFEARRRLRSGELRDVLVSVDMMQLGGERCTLAILLDITGRKRAELERAAALEQFEKIFQAVPLITAITSLKGGRLIEVNAAFCAFVGREREELIGRKVAELGLWSDLREREALVAELRRAGRVASYQARLRSARGEERVLLGSAERIEFHGESCTLMIGADITERVRAEQAVQDSEAKLRKLIDGTGPSIFIGLLAPDGTLLEANRPALEASGLAWQDVIGKPFDQTFWWSWSEAVRGKLRAAIARAAAGDVVRYDEQIRLAAGVLAWIDFSLAPLRDAGGAVEYLVPSAIVIDERKRYEEALRKSSARLEALTRRLLEVQETERRTVARELHDEVGGVLTAVKLNLQALQRKGVAPAGKAALEDSLALVDGAIQSVRSLSLDLRPAVLDDLGLIPALKWYCERQARRADVAIELALEAIDLKFAPQLESACFRIVQEAITNALRHANARRIAVALRRSDGGFELEIVDDGGGFDVAARARGLPSAGSGLLGMEERAMLLGGRVTIESAPGAGTRVRAELPPPLKEDA